MAKRRIFIVDDHPVFREGMVRIVSGEEDLLVCGEAADAVEALKRIESSKAELAIVDISLEGMSGIDLIRSIRQKNASLRFLVVSMHPESLHAERALRAGANGYIMKKEPAPALIAAIRQVLSGRTYASPELNERLLQKISSPATGESIVDRLSERELEVFELIGQGFGTREIAERLNVSMKTVETHRGHIREKLNLLTTSELVQRAIHWIHRENAS